MTGNAISTRTPRRPLMLPAVLLVAACSDGGNGISAGSTQPDSGVTPISAVQGSGNSSPLNGRSVTIRGIVTGDFQDDDADMASDLGGFFVQSESADGDPSTSDGIFIYDANGTGVDVVAGDRVVVTGGVQEHFGETQISATMVERAGSGTPQPVDFELPATGVTTNSDGETIADLEAFEGMLVRLTRPLFVTELRNLERYGELQLAQNERLYQFTNQNRPGARAYRTYRETNARRSIVLDDGKRASNVVPIRYLGKKATTDGSLRIGDTVNELVGVLRYSRGSGGSGTETWRIMPVSEPVIVNTNPRPARPDIDGALRIAGFNTLNYFSTIDNGDARCGATGSQDCRGADSDAEHQRQLQKLVTALAMIDADIVGLIELENNDSQSLADIVDALNSRLGGNVYSALETGAIGEDGIKTGFVFKATTVEPAGTFAVLDSSADERFNDRRNRPALAQTFSQISNSATLTVVVNHLKAKGSDCNADGDPNTGDGQGNCNRVRTEAAMAIADWLTSDPTSSGDPDFLIIGDLNAYTEEDPLRALTSSGYTNLVPTLSGDAGYSFVFDGQSGALDHALASSSLVPQVVAAMEWHINADEPRVRDYNLEFGRDPALFEANTPFRASDHDPIIIGIDLN